MGFAPGDGKDNNPKHNTVLSGGDLATGRIVIARLIGLMIVAAFYVSGGPLGQMAQETSDFMEQPQNGVGVQYYGVGYRPIARQDIANTHMCRKQDGNQECRLKGKETSLDRYPQS